METANLTPKDRERYARARAKGKARLSDASAVISAGYDAGRDAINVSFRGGGSMNIPRQMIPDLLRAPARSLEQIGISPAGDALYWPSLDVQVYVPGLVERAFGMRLFAAATARRGGAMAPRHPTTRSERRQVSRFPDIALGEHPWLR